MTDTKRLRELAEAEYKSREPNSDGMYSVGKSTLGTYMRFIAAASPQAIIALIDELESVKAQLAEANEALKFYGDEKNWEETWCDFGDDGRDGDVPARIDFDDCDELEDESGPYLGPAGKRARQYLEKYKERKP